MSKPPERKKVIIMGAAGRDFHNFNILYRDNPSVEVVAFTATQIPYISERHYPDTLSGALYPMGIPIEDETQLEHLCRQFDADEVAFSYSDIPHEAVMHTASRVLATGADFVLPGPANTMVSSTHPVISVTAVRTGCGKSQICRWIFKRLRDEGIRVSVLRHPMPYGDLARQAVQRFGSIADMDAADCTNEEREEYEPYIEAGGVIFAGVDYEAILREAEAESDVILWDGGNNDFSFIRPNLSIVVADALRPDQVASHHPGETVARMADVFVINKIDSAPEENLAKLTTQLKGICPSAPIVQAASPVHVDRPEDIQGRRVLVVEDGPTITHGGMPHGAGFVAAQQYGAAEIVDPRASAAREIAEVYRLYPHIGKVLPALGYSDDQLEALGQTIERSDAEVVLVATPFDLSRRLDLKKPSIRVSYDYKETGAPNLENIIDMFVREHSIIPR